MLHTLLFFTLVLHSCAAFCAYQVCAKAQILRVKNLIFHTSLHSAGTKCRRNREPNVRFGSAINAICGACGTNSCVKNQISICIFHTNLHSRIMPMMQTHSLTQDIFLQIHYIVCHTLRQSLCQGVSYLIPLRLHQRQP